MVDKVSPPLIPEDDPHRASWCQFALHLAFEKLMVQANAAGWRKEEVAWALIGLADRNLQTVLSDTKAVVGLPASRKLS